MNSKSAFDQIAACARGQHRAQYPVRGGLSDVSPLHTHVEPFIPRDTPNLILWNGRAHQPVLQIKESLFLRESDEIAWSEDA